MTANLLASETSPYLLQHKDNPVHWRPWGQAAFDEAKAQNKPVLLSVGYTACHWCHVMNHESFEDGETAKLINQNYVPVKVDREERPDIDQLYQTAAQTMGSNGGWPLTVFLNHEGKPFFAGTYFPKEDRFGQPAFKRVLEDVSRHYREQPEQLAGNLKGVHEALTNTWTRDMRGGFDPQMLDVIATRTATRFDIFYGGLSGAPKFPSVPLVEMMWRAYLRTGAPQFLQVTATTLDNMCMGGIYDHVGGGFSRYSVDDRWIVPHFEKMLYDNAQMIEILTLVWQNSRAPLAAARVEETIGWLMREMKVEDAFASSIDADSEGHEGKFYVWSDAELDVALAGTFSRRFKELFNVRPGGNFEGKHILHRLGVAYPLAEADEAMIKKQLELLLAAREKRVRPERDDKVLADWNGMTAAALVKAGVAFARPEWVEAGRKCFDFIIANLSEGDRLVHSWARGKKGAPGFSDDYAHMARAAIILWEATGEKKYLDRAIAFADALQSHFYDEQNGGYFATARDGDPILVRMRGVHDTNAPAANGVMVEVLARLHIATAARSWFERAIKQIDSFAGELSRAHLAMGSFVNGFETLMWGLSVVIVGPRDSAKTKDLIAAVNGRSLPNRVLIVVDPKDGLPADHIAHGKPMEGGQPTAYVCQRQTCSPPVTSPVQLSQMLQMPQARA